MNKLLTAKIQPLRFENWQNVLVCVKRLFKVYKKNIVLRKSHGNYGSSYTLKEKILR